MATERPEATADEILALVNRMRDTAAWREQNCAAASDRDKARARRLALTHVLDRATAHKNGIRSIDSTGD